MCIYLDLIQLWVHVGNIVDEIKLCDLRKSQIFNFFTWATGLAILQYVVGSISVTGLDFSATEFSFKQTLHHEN